MSDLGDALTEPEPGVDQRGELLRMPEILARTGMPDGTVRSRYHAGTMPCVWKLGRRLVAWERDLIAWLDDERERTSKAAQS